MPVEMWRMTCTKKEEIEILMIWMKQALVIFSVFLVEKFWLNQGHKLPLSFLYGI